MDGFMINKRFYFKELGIFKIGDATARSVFFNLGIRWSDLTAKDRKTCQYVTRHIHKLPFGVPRGVKASEICELENIVNSFYREVKRSESSVLGYKGGHVEEDLLERLDIPCVNLERFGCLKAEELMKEMIWLETCGNHTTADAYLHCAKMEVEAYAHWMENNELFY